MTHVSHRILLTLAALAPVALGAQAAAPAPPNRILAVFRETVKIGKGGQHDAHETAWAAANAAAKYPMPMLAAQATTGANETWYMSAFPTWAAFEQANKAVDANPALAAIGKQYSAKEDEFLSDGRSMLLERRDDLSYGPPADLAASRFFTITRYTIRPGHAAEFEENRKMIKAAHETAHMADGQSVWESRSGAPTGTVFTIVAHKTMAELDSAAMTHGAAYQAALGGAEAQKKMQANIGAAVISSESNNFAFVPSQSLPPAEWIAADPGFWKPKPAMKKAP
jgi:hypothetical protein